MSKLITEQRLEKFARVATARQDMTVIIENVHDPHNIGAIMRSAAAFDVGGIIVQDKHAPRENATIAKTAAGALEMVPLVAVTNLTRALKELQEEGYWSIGMAGEAKQTIDQLNLDPKTVLVMGAQKAADYAA